MDSDVKTRVTAVEQLQLPGGRGQDALVIIYSSDPRHFGKRYVLGDEPLTIGRDSDNTLVLEKDSVSRRHCRVEAREGQYFVTDQGSTNGTYVNDRAVDSCQLRRGDQLKVGDTILKYLTGSDVEAQYHETIYRMTIIDALTGIPNKRYLLDTLEREIPRANRHRRPLSLLIFDIDHFKSVNDTLGHLAGDFVLKELAQLVYARLRPDDVLSRYGGEEFAVVLPETPVEGGARIAEEIRQRAGSHPFEFEGERLAVTLSLGVAELRDNWSAHELLKAADEQLYVAKRSGRNQVAS